MPINPPFMSQIPPMAPIPSPMFIMPTGSKIETMPEWMNLMNSYMANSAQVRQASVKNDASQSKDHKPGYTNHDQEKENLLKSEHKNAENSRLTDSEGESSTQAEEKTKSEQGSSEEVNLLLFLFILHINTIFCSFIN